MINKLPRKRAWIWPWRHKKWTRNPSGDDITNVNFFMTTSLTTFTQCAPEATEFGEITQNKGHYAVQGHSGSPILIPIESSYTTSYVINTNLPPMLHRFRDIAFDRSKIANRQTDRRSITAIPLYHTIYYTTSRSKRLKQPMRPCLPNHVVLSDTVNRPKFKSRLDKFWQHQDVISDFKVEIHETGNRSCYYY